MKSLIHLTTDGEDDVGFALACARSLRADGHEVVLLCHRDGAPIGVAGSAVVDRIRDAVEEGVDVAVSEGCLRARSVPVEPLAGVRVARKGSIEAVRLQHDGHALLKVP